MKFTLAAAILSLATSVYAQGCAEAQRFGSLHINPMTVKVGQVSCILPLFLSRFIYILFQPFTITNNLTCAIEKGNRPMFIDHWLDAANNNGFQPPLYLGRSTLDPSHPPAANVFHTKV